MTDGVALPAEKEGGPLSLRVEITAALNRCSAENGSDTPDFVLAEFLLGCLAAFDTAVACREKWYGPRVIAGAAVAQVGLS